MFNFKGNYSFLASKEAKLFYISTSSEWAFHLLHILTNILGSSRSVNYFDYEPQ